MHPGNNAGEFRTFERGSSWTDWTLINNPTLSWTLVADPVIFEWDGTWYAFIGKNSTETYLFYADTFNDLIAANWSEHPDSPVHTSDSAVRPAGRPLIRDNYIDFMWMDNVRSYGDRVRVYRITDLSTSTFSDTEIDNSPLIQGTFDSGSWTEGGMHHVETTLAFAGGHDLVFVDGADGNGEYAIGVYAPADTPESQTKAYLSGSTQSIANNTLTKVAFDAVERDYERGYDTSVSEFSPAYSGQYQLKTIVRLQTPTAGGRVLVQIQINGSSASYAEREITAGDYPTLTTSTVEMLSPSDTVTVHIKQLTGSSQDIRHLIPNTFFEATLMQSN
jgi:hypothetical protein